VRFCRTRLRNRHIAVDGFAGQPHWGYFALYDGHGGRGAVEFTVRALHLNFAHALVHGPPQSAAQLVEDAYLKTDGQIRRQNITSSGTTAVTCWLQRSAALAAPPAAAAAVGVGARAGPTTLHVANVGDARAVLCRGGTAVRLSKGTHTGF
jgi:protein phosphatase PTC1